MRNLQVALEAKGTKEILLAKIVSWRKGGLELAYKTGMDPQSRDGEAF